MITCAELWGLLTEYGKILTPCKGKNFRCQTSVALQKQCKTLLQKATSAGSFFWWGKPEFTWYVGHCVAYCSYQPE
jgi:hypothetical protein